MYQDQERTRPYGSPATARVFLHQLKHGSSGRLVIFAAIVGLLGLALGAASLAFFLSYRSSVTAQMQTIRQELNQAQSSLSSNSSSVNGLSNKISAINAAMAAIAPYNQVCSQALIGQNGPATFYFMCSDLKP